MIASALAGLAAVALFLAPGCGLSLLLPRRPLPERLAYAYLLGVAWVAGSLYALSHFLHLPLARPAVLAVAALPTLAGLAVAWRRQRGRKGSATGKRPRRPQRSAAERGLTAVAVLLAAIVSAGLFADAISEPVTDWDGRMTWSAQAKYVRAARTVDAPILRDERLFITHPRYPLLLPLAQLAVADALGQGEDEHAFRALYAAFFPAFLLLVHAAARRAAGRIAAALAVAAAAAVPFLAFGEGGAATAYCDLPLACFYGGALLLLLSRPPRRGGRFAAGLAAGLLLAAAVLTKNEGAILALAAVLLAVAEALRASRGRLTKLGHRCAVLLPAAALGAGALGLLRSWAAPIPNRFDEGYSVASLAALRAMDWGRVPIVLAVLRHQLFLWNSWTLFWWAVPLVLMAGVAALRRQRAWPLLLAAAAPLAVAALAYAVHRDPVYLATVTWNRFLLQAAVPGLAVVAMALRAAQDAAAGSPPTAKPPSAGAAPTSRGSRGGGRSSNPSSACG